MAYPVYANIWDFQKIYLFYFSILGFSEYYLFSEVFEILRLSRQLQNFNYSFPFFDIWKKFSKFRFAFNCQIFRKFSFFRNFRGYARIRNFTTLSWTSFCAARLAIICASPSANRPMKTERKFISETFFQIVF